MSVLKGTKLASFALFFPRICLAVIAQVPSWPFVFRWASASDADCMTEIRKLGGLLQHAMHENVLSISIATKWLSQQTKPPTNFLVRIRLQWLYPSVRQKKPYKSFYGQMLHCLANVLNNLYFGNFKKIKLCIKNQNFIFF